jgi:hypothetical protein
MPNYKAAFESASLDLSAIMSLLGFTSYPGIDPMLRAITDLVLAKAESQALRDEVAALRARVVVPERMAASPVYFEGQRAIGWNACLDELARLNGKVVSEGLLRDLLKSAQKLSDRAAGFAVSGVEFIEIGDNNSAIVELEVTLDELRALLGEGKENGHA